MSTQPSLQQRSKRRKERRGVALILVLGAITILTVFLTELQEETSSELSAAIADRDALRAEYYARSGVNLARLLIAAEPTVRKTITPMFAMLGKKPPQIPVWEFSDMVLGPFNDSIGAQAFGGLSGLDVSTGKNLGIGGGGNFLLSIVDEDSKLNVNISAKTEPNSQRRLAAQIMGLVSPQQYNPMFEGRDADGQFTDRLTVCGALVDWADYDELLYNCDPTSNAGSEGAEDSFYQTIGLPYMRKNAAYDSLEELRLVRGMGDDFWSTFVDPDPGDPKKRLMTVWGQDKINVNTANAQTLLFIVCGNVPDAPLCLDVQQMQSFVMGVTLAKSLLLGAPVFSSEKDFIETMKGQGLIGPILTTLGVQPVTFRSEAEVKKTIGTSSKVFSIYADGVVPGRQRETRVRIHAVVDYRKALAPGNPFSPLANTGTNGSAAGQAQQQPANNQSAAAATPEAIAAAAAANPAGNVVYWRLE